MFLTKLLQCDYLAFCNPRQIRNVVHTLQISSSLQKLQIFCNLLVQQHLIDILGLLSALDALAALDAPDAPNAPNAPDALDALDV